MDSVELGQEENRALKAPEDAAPEEDPKEDSPLAAEAGGGGGVDYPELSVTMILAWSADILELKEDSKE